MFKSLSNIQDELSQLTQDIDLLQSSLQGDSKSAQPLNHETNQTFFFIWMNPNMMSAFQILAFSKPNRTSKKVVVGFDT